jgi:hypothetical protein
MYTNIEKAIYFAFKAHKELVQRYEDVVTCYFK